MKKDNIIISLLVTIIITNFAYLIWSLVDDKLLEFNPLYIIAFGNSITLSSLFISNSLIKTLKKYEE